MRLYPMEGLLQLHAEQKGKRSDVQALLGHIKMPRRLRVDGGRRNVRNQQYKYNRIRLYEQAKAKKENWEVLCRPLSLTVGKYGIAQGV